MCALFEILYRFIIILMVFLLRIYYVFLGFVPRGYYDNP